MDFKRLGVRDTRTVFPDRIRSSKSIAGESGLYTETVDALDGCCCCCCVGDVTPLSRAPELRFSRLKNRKPFLLPEEFVELMVFVVVLVVIIEVGLAFCELDAFVVVEYSDGIAAPGGGLEGRL